MTLLAKYVFLYLYLLLVMLTAYVVSKKSKNTEISRNIVHICAGLGWILYKIFFPTTIHPIIISGSFVALTIFTYIKKIDFIERKKSSLGTILYTLSMFVMSILGYKNNLLFNIFGAVIICLSFGDAFANIFGRRIGKTKIYKNKTLQGTIACCASVTIAMFCFENIFSIGLQITSILIVAVLCALTELFSGDYDNIAIPSVTYITLYILLTDGFNRNYIFSFLIGIFMFFFSLKLKLLSISASYMLFFMISVLFYCGGYRSYLALMLIFLLIIITEKVLKSKNDVIFKDINKEHGIRNERQLIANALIAVLAIIIYGFTNNHIFIVAFIATLAETIGDSMASAVGVLSKSDPIDICSFKKIQKGISGGISILGTVVSLAVCVYSAIIYEVIYKDNIKSFIVIVISSFIGIVLDSILGSKIQIQYRCTKCNKLTEKEIHCNATTKKEKGFKFFDNSRINFLCNIFSFGMACVLMKG